MASEAQDGVFVSYARDDGAGFARQLVLDLQAQGIEAWLDRREMYGGQAWRRQIVDAIGQAAYLILILTPAAMSSEVVSWEWQVARRQGVCVFPVRADPSLDVELAPRWMADLHWYTLDEEWDTLVADLRGPCEIDRVPFMAGQLPTGYVTRARELAAAKKLLLGNRGDPLTPTVVLHGPGGYGKTTMALALCHDEDIGAAFHEGVLWVSLGQQPDLVTELDRIHRALTGRSSGAVDVQEAEGALHERLAQRRCLVVVDDVWRRSDLRPFLQNGSPSVTIVTTRQFDVALEMADTARLRIDEMTESEALDLLAYNLDGVSADLRPYRGLVERLGAWPLLVSLARGALRARAARGATVQAALISVGEALDRRGLTAFDKSNPSERNEAAAASVAVSLEQLAGDDVTRWAELAVFPEDTPIPLGTVAQLWATDLFEAEELATRFDDASLLHLDLDDATIAVHDELIAVAQQRIDDQGSLHQRLLHAWGDLRTLPETDRYAWRWVVHHLVGAGQQDQLRDLLLDPQWMQRRLAGATVEALLADFDLVPDEPPYRSVREALQLSAGTLAADASQLPGQLRGRLLSTTQVPGLIALLDLAGRLPGTRLVPLRASLRVPPSAAPDAAAGHESTVVALAAADGGRVVVSGSGDGVLKIWDVRSGALLRTIPDDMVAAEPPRPPWEPSWGGARGPLLAGFANSRHVVASAAGRLTVWDLDRGSRLRVIDIDPPQGEGASTPSAPKWPDALGATADGRYVVSALGGSLIIWDQQTGDVRSAPSNRVTTLVFADEGRVVTGSSEFALGKYPRDEEELRHNLSLVNALRVWDLTTARQIRTLEGHPCGVNALTAAADGRLVASAPNPGLYHHQDPCPRLWDMNTGAQLQAFQGHRFTVTAVAITPDQRVLVSGGGNCFQRYEGEFTVKFWDMHTGELRRSFDVHKGPVVTVLVTPDSRWAVSAGGICSHALRTSTAAGSYTHDGSIRVWDLATETLVATFQGDYAATCMVLPDLDTIVAGSLDGAVHILRLHR